MNMHKILKLALISVALFAANVKAEALLNHLTDTEAKYAGPTVEDNIVAMDTDKNGFADASEVRAYLELKHGKGYESELLNKFADSIKGTSCGTPFAKRLYVSN